MIKLSKIPALVFTEPKNLLVNIKLDIDRDLIVYD